MFMRACIDHSPRSMVMPRMNDRSMNNALTNSHEKGLMMKRRIVTICVILALVGLIPTADAQISVLGELSHEHAAGPGETYEGEIIVLNKGEKVQEVKLYQTDYLFFCNGGNLYGEPGKTSRSNALWISFHPKRFMVAPKQQEVVRYTVKVPEKDGMAGTYWSMIMVEPITPDSPESSMAKKEDLSIGVRQVFRYGIQIATHIQETGERMLKFLDARLVTEEGKKILRVDVENVGERYLRPLLSVELYTNKGVCIGKFEGGQLRTYPGTSVRFKTDLGSPASDIYKALVVADCGGDDIFGATYNLIINK